MILRAVGVLAVVLSVGVSTTWPLEDGPDPVEPRVAAPAKATAAPEAPDAGVQQAVNYAFTQVVPDDAVVFALGSAQSSRVEGGGRRFDGTGIASWNQANARFVSFTMTLSAAGELVEFDYSTPQDLPPDQALASVDTH